MSSVTHDKLGNQLIIPKQEFSSFLWRSLVLIETLTLWPLVLFLERLDKPANNLVFQESRMASSFPPLLVFCDVHKEKKNAGSVTIELIGGSEERL